MRAPRADPEPEPKPLLVKARALRALKAVLEALEERKPILKARVLPAGFSDLTDDDEGEMEGEKEVAAAITDSQAENVREKKKQMQIPVRDYEILRERFYIRGIFFLII